MTGRVRHSLNSSYSTSSSKRNPSPFLLVATNSPPSSHHSPLTSENYTSESVIELQPTVKHLCWPISYKFKYLKSKGAILILILSLLILSCVDGLYSILLPSILEYDSAKQPKALQSAFVNIIRATVYIFYPLAGWLADTYIGRSKMIIISMWIVFLATLVTAVITSLQYGYSFSSDEHLDKVRLAMVVKYVYPLLFVATTIGVSGFHANLIPFGLDQLQDASGDELMTFIRWYCWTVFVSSSIIFNSFFTCSTYDQMEHQILMIQSCVYVTCGAIALSLYYVFQHWLLKERAVGNPFTKILQVLNYARKHKYPRCRSAFTYWEKGVPSRIDFAKMIYGGPFKTEEVEDVKTFYRMLTVLSTLIIVFTAVNAPIDSIGLLAKHLKGNPSVPNDTLAVCFFDSLLENLGFLVGVIAIPLYDFLVNPFIQNCIPTSLKRVGFGSLLFATSILCSFILDTVGHTSEHKDTISCDISCLFSNTTTHDLLLDYHITTIPGFLAGLALPIVAIGIYEFICAQAPNSMKGLFVGIAYCTIGLGGAFGFLLMLPFYIHPSLDWPVSCGFWYYLLNLLIIVTGFVVFCTAARCYKRRERDDPTFEQANVEAHYETTLIAQKTDGRPELC